MDELTQVDADKFLRGFIVMDQTEKEHAIGRLRANGYGPTADMLFKQYLGAL